MKDDIADLYESVYNNTVSSLLVEVDTDTTSGGEESSHNISIANIYIKPERGPIQRPYTGKVVNSTRLENNYTIIANDSNTNKLIQVILLDDGDISVSIQDESGRVQDTFMGQDLDFYDGDSEEKELNIIKIENV